MFGESKVRNTKQQNRKFNINIQSSRAFLTKPGALPTFTECSDNDKTREELSNILTIIFMLYNNKELRQLEVH